MPQIQEHRQVQDAVRAHAGWVYSCAKRRVRDDALADDVAQAVFILFWQRQAKLAGEAKLTGWLYQAVRYCSANALRRRQIRQHHEKEAAMAGLQDAAGLAQWDEISPELEQAVDRLRDKYRAAVLLRFYRQMSFAEVGQSLGISEEAARKRVDRALESLRGALADKGVTAGVGALGVVMAEKVTAAAPAGLVEAATAAAGGGGAGSAAGSAGVIAKGAMKMMAWAKMKVAAVWATVFFTAAMGGAVVVEKARTGTSAHPGDGAAAVSMAAGGSAGVALPTVPVTTGYRELQIARWQVLVDAPLAEKMRALGKPIDSASKGCEVLKCDGEAVRTAIRGAQGTKAVISDNLGFALPHMELVERFPWTSSVASDWTAAISASVLLQGDDKQTYSFTSAGAGALKLEPHRGFLRETLEYNSLNVGLVSPARRSAEQASLDLTADVQEGEAIVCLAAVGKVGSQDVTHAIVWQVFLASAVQMDYIRHVCSDLEWIRLGPAGMIKMADEGIAWAERGLDPADAGGARWTKKLAGGGTVRLVAVGRPKEHPYRWWDGEGEAVAFIPQWVDRIGQNEWEAVIAITDPDAGNGDFVTNPYLAPAYPPNPRAGQEPAYYAEVQPRGEAGQVPPVTFGIGTGAWRELGRIEPGKELIVEGRGYRLKAEGVFHKSAAGPGMMRVELACDEQEDLEVTVAMVGKGGRQLADPLPQVLGSLPQGTVTDYGRQRSVLMDIDDVDRYVVVARPRQWVTFTDFAQQVRHFAEPRPQAAPATTPSTVPASSRPTPGTPQAWAYALADAVEAGDVAATKQALYASTPLGQRFADALAQQVVAAVRLRHLAVTRYGADATRRVLANPLSLPEPGSLRAMRFQPDGERQKPFAPEGPCLATVAPLALIDGQWKVDLRELEKVTEADVFPELQKTEAMNELIKQAIRDVETGRYENIEDLRDALRQQWSETTKTAGAATRP